MVFAFDTNKKAPSGTLELFFDTLW